MIANAVMATTTIRTGPSPSGEQRGEAGPRSSLMKVSAGIDRPAGRYPEGALLAVAFDGNDHVVRALHLREDSSQKEDGFILGTAEQPREKRLGPLDGLVGSQLAHLGFCDVLEGHIGREVALTENLSNGILGIAKDAEELLP